MVAPLDAATRQSIIEQAQAIAAQQGISPEQALWNYAQGQGLSASDVDTYMGFPAGTTQNWAVLNGQAPAPQGNFNPTVQAAPPPPPPAPAPPAPVAPPPTPVPTNASISPLTAAERAEVTRKATSLAQAAGTTPEYELYKFAKDSGIDATDVDTYMGWDRGTTQGWALQNRDAINTYQAKEAAAKAAADKAASAPAPVKPLDAATRASVIQQAQAIAGGTPGMTPEQALYNYGKTNSIKDSDMDTYMGWPAGTTSAWANKTQQPDPTKTVGALTSSVSATGAYGLDPATRQSIIDQAKAIAAQQGITPERALYNYADANKIGVQDVDTYMGWGPGTTQYWATNNVPGFTPPPGAQGTSQVAPLATSQVAPLATTQVAPLSTVPPQPMYKLPVLNSLYQNQQQRMTSAPPQFNFQAQQTQQVAPLTTQQPGALTNVISNT